MLYVLYELYVHNISLCTSLFFFRHWAPQQLRGGAIRHPRHAKHAAASALHPDSAHDCQNHPWGTGLPELWPSILEGDQINRKRS